MAVSCGARCAKFMLFLFNFIFFMSGATLLGTGILMILDQSLIQILIKYADDSDQMRTVAYLFAGVGVFVFVVGFVGCLGAVKESKAMLGVYIFLLLVVMCVEITAAVLALALKDRVEDKVGGKLRTTLLEDEYYNNSTKLYSAFGVAFNFAQKAFNCCGIQEPYDYDNSTFQKNNRQLVIPYSCCQLKDNVTFTEDSPTENDVKDWQACQADYPEGKDGQLNTDGCKTGIVDWAKTKLIVLIGIARCVAALNTFGIVFAVCLCINPEKPWAGSKTWRTRLV